MSTSIINIHIINISSNNIIHVNIININITNIIIINSSNIIPAISYDSFHTLSLLDIWWHAPFTNAV